MADTFNKILDRLGLQRKSAPDYGRADALTSNFRFEGWGWNKSKWGTRIDYAGEVGPLENSSLIAAILNWTAMQLPEADPVVYVRDGKGDETAEPGHPAAQIIRRPNAFHTWSNYTGGLSADWWIAGNVTFKKERDLGGQLQELWYLPDYMVKERWPGDKQTPDVPRSGKNKAQNDFLSHYQFSAPGKDPVLIPASDIIRIKRFINLANPRRGIGAFDAVVKEIYGDEKAALFAATILRNMGIVVPLLSPKDKDVTVNETQAAAIKEKWVQGTTGDNTGVPMVNTIALEATKFAFSPQELDLSELRKVPESRVAAVTGIPAIVLQFLVGLEHGHYGAAYEQARQQGYESVIIPIQNDIAEQLSLQLLYEFDGEKAKNQEIRFDTSHVRVLQEDRDKMYARTSEAFRVGITTLNEARSSLGKKDLGEDGEIRLIPSMSTPMTIERIKLIAEGNQDPPPPDPNAEALGKLADVDRLIRHLEDEMKGFEIPK